MPAPSPTNCTTTWTTTKGTAALATPTALERSVNDRLIDALAEHEALLDVIRELREENAKLRDALNRRGMRRGRHKSQPATERE